MLDADTLHAQIQSLEREIVDKKLALSNLRKQVQKREVVDYLFKDQNGEVKLSDMFGDKHELIVIHNMGTGCAWCTMWADGFNGVLQHIENKTAFAVTSPDHPHVQAEFAMHRNWNMKMYSTHENNFRKDMGFVNEQGRPIPGISVFEKDRDGKMFLAAFTGLGPHDNYCTVYDLFDLLPSTYEDVDAKFAYD